MRRRCQDCLLEYCLVCGILWVVGVSCTFAFQSVLCCKSSIFDPLKAPEPTTLEEALRRPDADLWWDAWLKERGQMDQYGVYEEVPEPKGVNIVGSKIVFKVKKNPDGSIKRYKCRLVARGFTQRYGCEF